MSKKFGLPQKIINEIILSAANKKYVNRNEQYGF